MPDIKKKILSLPEPVVVTLTIKSLVCSETAKTENKNMNDIQQKRTGHLNVTVPKHQKQYLPNTTNAKINTVIGKCMFTTVLH